jgi:dihydroxyacetone kinase-like predicted kinase
MVVGEGDVLRVHIHSDHPGEVLEKGLGYGSLHNIRINNMRDQFEEVKRDRGGVAVVAVCTGEGFAALFANLGAVVVPGGQTMNPSAGEIAAAVDGAGTGAVIILPNNPNIVLAALQVRDLTEREVHVVPSNSMPQGLSALLAFKPEENAASNTGRMQAAAAKVATVEITCAVRDAKIGGREVKAGEFLAIIGEEPVASGDNLGQVTVAAMQKTAGGMNLVTLYYGSEVERPVAEEIAGRLAEALPGVELEIQYGGQPFYHFLAAVE